MMVSVHGNIPKTKYIFFLSSKLFQQQQRLNSVTINRWKIVLVHSSQKFLRAAWFHHEDDVVMTCQSDNQIVF